MMYCRKCGKSIPDDSKFCPYCGETVTVNAESTGQELSTDPQKAKENECGVCSNCGKTLPPGKLTGLCNDCMKQIGYDPDEYQYGRCEDCGAPLESDDSGTLCKKCIEKRFGNYMPNTPMKENPIDNQRNSNETLRHKGYRNTIFAVIGVFLLIYIISAVMPHEKADTAQTTEQNSQVASGSNSTAAANAAASKVSSAVQNSPGTPDLELLSDDGTFDSDINTIHITGKVKNNSGKVLSYVQIQFALYDKSGSQVGTALANTNGLEPGNTWSYDAIGMASNVSKFKVINLSGY